MAPRIALIHALQGSLGPIASAFHDDWPEAETLNILDDSLSKDETAAVANDLGVSEKEVTEMEQRLYSTDVAFDPAPNDDEEKPYAPALYLPSDEADPANALEDDDWNSQASNRLLDALETLDERSRDILQSRWLTEQKATLHELADKYGVSAERIRQIEKNAIAKLKTSVMPA